MDKGGKGFMLIKKGEVKVFARYWKSFVYVGFGGDRPEAWVIKNKED